MKKEEKAIGSGLWNARLSWLWLNDEQIFEYTQEDFDRKAEEFARNGVTDVENFGITHFRLSFYPYWKEIIECIRKVVVACHKAGIRVHEHASAHLTLALASPDGWDHFERFCATYSSGSKVSYDTWKKIFPFLTVDFKINGKDLRSFCQIDGLTGEPLINRYGAYAMCFNNPDYREIYFEHMKDICATGIDGIMNDDIQFFGENACACEHCRKLFKEKTGYSLPTQENWADFVGDYDNPVFIAWKKFKFESTERMYRDLSELYKSLGINMMRWNYSSTVLRENSSFYSFERCMDIWDMVMQENCFSTIMRLSYPDYFAESVHRFAAAERRGVPAMSLFYPSRTDDAYFAWALSRSWGQLYTGTHEGHDISHLEKTYREFEEKYKEYYKEPKKLRDISFYFSMKPRDYKKDPHEYTYRLMAGIQSAYFSNLGVDMVMENDSVEELIKHKVIVVSSVSIMNDDELERLVEYVKQGGRLVIFGEFATSREDGSTRSIEEAEKIFGTTLRQDEASILGDGEIVRLSYQTPKEDFQEWIWAERRQEIPETGIAIPSKRKQQREGTGKVLLDIVKTPKLTVECDNEDVIVTAFKTDAGLALHLMNLKDTIPDTACTVDHTDIIKNFTADGEKVPEVKISVELPCEINTQAASLVTPEREAVEKLCVKVYQNRAEIIVPAGLFSGYALVTVDAE